MVSRIAQLTRVGVLVVACSCLAPLAEAEIFVTNDGTGSVTVYADAAVGNAAPLRSITGISGGPRGIFVDAVNGEVFVATQSDQILVFGINASGPAAPLRTISQNSSGDTAFGDFQGIHVDLVNNEIFVANRDGSVTVFARTANGSLAPSRAIAGPLTGLSEPRGVFVDTANNEVFVADNGNSTIRVFARTGPADSSPLRVISSTSPSLGDLSQIFVDAVNNEVTVANYSSVDAVRTWGRTANGDTPPLRSIEGGATGLDSPRGVSPCAGGTELVVANRNGDSIQVFNRTANGNATPLRTISGAQTGLSSPRFVGCTSGSIAETDRVIPTLGTWSLALFALALLTSATWQLRRM